MFSSGDIFSDVQVNVYGHADLSATCEMRCLINSFRTLAR